MESSKPWFDSAVRLIVLYLCLCILIALILFKAGNGQKYYQLTKRSVKTTGIVSQTLCSRHQQFDYEFQVNGVRFNGLGTTNVGASCDSLKHGDPVVIFYSSENPNISINDEEPMEAFRNEIIPVGVGAIIFPGLIIFGIWLHKPKRKNGT